jgi:hypothetical protein
MRRVYIYVNGELVEKGSVAAAPVAPDSGALWGDRHYTGLRASDGTDISTRSKHREYMKRTGLTTVDDFGQHFATEEAKRRDFFAGRDPSRAADVARAMERRK